MNTNVTVPALVVGASAAPPSAVPPSAPPSIAPLPPSITDPAIATPVPVLPAYAKPFLDISRIEVFFGKHFKHWQERIYSTLDMHGVAWLLSTENTLPNSEVWTYANKVC